MLTTSRVLRAAAILTLLLALGHMVGGNSSWSPMGETDVLRAMREKHYDVLGWSRSYLDFFLGFGHTVSACLLMQAVLLWQLAGAAAVNPGAARPMTATFLLANAAIAVITGMFLFVIPLTFSVLITVCLVIARWKAGRQGSSVILKAREPSGLKNLILLRIGVAQMGTDEILHPIRPGSG